MHLIRAASIEGFNDLVSRLGVNPNELLAQVGFNRDQLRQPEALVSYQKIADLLDSAAKACDDPVFGLRLAQQQTALALGELAFSTGKQATIRESIEYAAAHISLHARGLQTIPHMSHSHIEMRLSFDFTNSSGLHQLILMSVGQQFNVAEALMGGYGKGLQINVKANLPTGPIEGLVNYQGVVNCNSHFNGLSIPAGWMDRPIVPNPELYEALLDTRRRVLEKRYSDDLPAQVRFLCSHIMPTGECSIENVARALGLHHRVLQIRLAEKSITFSKLLQRSRLAIAKQELQFGSLNMMEISMLLGYSELAVFSRHFKSWTGLSPRQWRVKHQSLDKEQLDSAHMAF